MVNLKKDYELNEGESVKLIGITSTERKHLFCSSNNHISILELANNLHFIVPNLLEGELDKITFISEEKGQEEKLLISVMDNILFLVYGIFSDYRGKWIIEQMEKYFSELVRDKDVNNLDESDKINITTEFEKLTPDIINQSREVSENSVEQERSTENTIRISYLGLSSFAIGVISLLLEESYLKNGSFNDNNLEMDEDMIESMITSKIEAIAVNTQATTNTIPRLISVEVRAQEYRHLTFKKYKNDYLLYLISEGNINKIIEVEAMLDLYLTPIVNKAFTGNLKPYDEVKEILKKDFQMINHKLTQLSD